MMCLDSSHLFFQSVEDVREQAIWALGNIAGDCHLYRDAILGSGAMQALMHMVMHEQKITLVRNAVWCISNLCRGKPQPNFDQVWMISHADKFLVNLLSWLTSELKTATCLDLFEGTLFFC